MHRYLQPSSSSALASLLPRDVLSQGALLQQAARRSCRVGQRADELRELMRGEIADLLLSDDEDWACSAT